eukprot:TRINITY_DN5627_c0_g1_i1.p2 TRINITY_DN5627_c0_g1~~TRINITY_DN5627_c0_g1_i1.p2  ORF type:complete len:197 (-),score=22.31 TRINITY_DN5627_c0_g1_i1:715-1305(-)
MDDYDQRYKRIRNVLFICHVVVYAIQIAILCVLGILNRGGQTPPLYNTLFLANGGLFGLVYIMAAIFTIVYGVRMWLARRNTEFRSAQAKMHSQRVGTVTVIVSVCFVLRLVTAIGIPLLYSQDGLVLFDQIWPYVDLWYLLFELGPYVLMIIVLGPVRRQSVLRREYSSLGELSPPIDAHVSTDPTVPLMQRGVL